MKTVSNQRWENWEGQPNVLHTRVEDGILKVNISDLSGRDLRVRLITPAPQCYFDQDLLKDLRTERATHGSCGIYNGSGVVLDYNGDILPCTHFAGLPLMNVFEEGISTREDFVTAWTDPSRVPAQFREEISRFPSDDCGGDYCQSCTGGCPLFWVGEEFDNEKIEHKIN